jgi:hypothetical protein
MTTWLQDGCPRMVVRFTKRVRESSIFLNVQTDSEPPLQSPIQWVPGIFSLGSSGQGFKITVTAI